jgi:glycosyltransferase involved in cell wall biosynthesis
MTFQNRPLITFALVAYNQERFICEAVAGAFSQTYSPLEIILSDDCSVDGTFQIMKDMAAVYRGPHKVILNRNSSNMGTGGHLNRIMELSSGEIIVGAAGDDVSLPERTVKTFQAFMESSDIYSVWTAVDRFAEDGRRLNDQWTVENKVFDRNAFNKAFEVLGCSHAWKRAGWDFFGPIYHKIIYEDGVISFRNVLLGKVKTISDVLVRYRVHSASITSKSQQEPERHRRQGYLRACSLLQALSDCFFYEMAYPEKRTEMEKIRLYLQNTYNMQLQAMSMLENYPHISISLLLKGMLYERTRRLGIKSIVQRLAPFILTNRNKK